MHHVAIMKKSWKLIPKILSGEKTIESRWYANRVRPWNFVTAEDSVYLKNSGEQIIALAKVSDIIQFSELTPEKVAWILKKYGKEIGIPKESIPKFYERFKDKKYCILVFLKDAKPIKPFHIDKTGFGLMSAWISVIDISKIRCNSATK